MRMALHISAYWPSEMHCTRLAVPHRAAYFYWPSEVHCTRLADPHGIAFLLTGLPECTAQAKQLRIVLHISPYWPSEVHCTRLAVPHRAAYFRLLRLRSPNPLQLTGEPFIAGYFSFGVHSKDYYIRTALHVFGFAPHCACPVIGLSECMEASRLSVASRV